MEEIAFLSCENKKMNAISIQISSDIIELENRLKNDTIKLEKNVNDVKKDNRNNNIDAQNKQTKNQLFEIIKEETNNTLRNELVNQKEVQSVNKKGEY